MSTVVYVLIGVAIIVGWIFAHNSESDRREAEAERLGLTVDKSVLGSGEMSGRYKGMSVNVSEFRKGSGKHSRTFTLVKGEVSSRLPAGFKLAHEDDLAMLGKIFGLQDVIVGHPRLDRTCVIKAKDPQEARDFFQRPGIADALAEFFERYDTALLKAGTLEVHRPGSSRANAGLVLDAMAKLDEVLAGKAEYRAPDAASVEAGLGDAHKVVEAELAKRRQGGSGD